VLVRFNTEGQNRRLAGWFPQDRRGIVCLPNAVVVDDLEAEFFSRDQMALLQRFNSEPAAVSLCSAAAESFHSSKYERHANRRHATVYLDTSRKPNC